MEIKPYITKIAGEAGIAADSLIFSDCEIAPEKVKVIMIDEAPPT